MFFPDSHVTQHLVSRWNTQVLGQEANTFYNITTPFFLQELKDGLNYGLYSPPINGRAGKFLEEERPLRDYPLPGPIGFLEVKILSQDLKTMTGVLVTHYMGLSCNLSLWIESNSIRPDDPVHKALRGGGGVKLSRGWGWQVWYQNQKKKKTNTKQLNTRKSSCVNARGIPPATWP